MRAEPEGKCCPQVRLSCCSTHPLAPVNIERILLVGDTHGNAESVRSLVRAARLSQAEVIVQLGDFGYWPHSAAGDAFLSSASSTMADAGLELVFIDGNHENHQDLRSQMPDRSGFSPIRPHLWWAPRGQRWQWRGVSFLALGGAVSLDRRMRVAGRSWWPEEATTKEDLSRAIGAGHADVMLTHDAPEGVLDPDLLRSRSSISPARWAILKRIIGAEELARSRANRELLREAAEAVSPRWLFHGHHHLRHKSSLVLATGQKVQVIGLNRDGSGDEQWLAIDLNTLSENSNPVNTVP